MLQYTPMPSDRGNDASHPSRTVSLREHEEVLSWLDQLGIDDGYIQEPARSDDWLPDFTRLNPFPVGQAEPIWHFESGYPKG